MKPDTEKLRKKYMDNPTEGMTSEDIRRHFHKSEFSIKQKKDTAEPIRFNGVLLLILPFPPISYNQSSRLLLPGDAPEYEPPQVETAGLVFRGKCQKSSL